MASAKEVAVLCLTWYVISIWSNIVTKNLLSKFPHPMTVTMTQLVAVTFLSIPTFNFWGNVTPSVERKDIQWKYYLRYIVPLSIGKFLGNLLNHVSIWKVPISYAQTVRASMPLFTVVLSRLILKEKQTDKIYFSLIPIVVGVAIATMTEISFNFIGLLSSLFSTMAFSLQNIYSKKVMHDTKIHHLHLLLTISKLSLLMFLPIWLICDAQNAFNTLKEMNITFMTIMLLLIDCLLNWLHNIVIFLVISTVTPLSFAVANACKLIFVIVVTLLFIGNPITTLNIVGMVMAAAGVFFYNKAKFVQQNNNQHTKSD